MEEIINQFQNDRIEVAKPPVNQPLPTGRQYYPTPTLASILFKKNAINSALSYDSKFIYEWNVYEQSEYQIITTLHNILMYSTISQTTDAKFITIGF